MNILKCVVRVIICIILAFISLLILIGTHAVVNHMFQMPYFEAIYVVVVGALFIGIWEVALKWSK
jgi:hypothetical protein